jgi:hypothetical protein
MRLTPHPATTETRPAHADPDAADTSRSPTEEAAPRSVTRRRFLTAGLCATGAVVLLLATPAVALADPVHTLALADSVGTVLDNVRNWIMGILAGLATVFLTIGGVRYVMAGGDPGEVQKAKIAFKSAGIGYGLAALAPLVVTVLKGIVGA